MLLQELKTRIHRQIPRKEQIKPMVFAYSANVLSKGPEYLAQAILFGTTYEAIKHHPDLVSLGIAAYAICALPQLVVNSQTLYELGWNAGYKSTTAFKALDIIFPKYKRASSIVAETADQIGNVYGFNVTGFIAYQASSALGDPVIYLSQRFASILTTGMFGMAINIRLLREARSKKSVS